MLIAMSFHISPLYAIFCCLIAMSFSQYVMKERTEAIATTRADNAMLKKTAIMLMGPVY